MQGEGFKVIEYEVFWRLFHVVIKFRVSRFQAPLSHCSPLLYIIATDAGFN